MKTDALKGSERSASLTANQVGLTVLLLALLALSLALAGCSQLPSNGFGASAPERQATDDSGNLIVGDPASSSQSVAVVNRAGQAITAVSLKLSTEADYGQPFLNQEWADSQTLQIFLSGQQDEQQDADAVQELLFDVKLQLSSGVVLEIADVELRSIESADLRIDNDTGFAYLEYQNALGMFVSTLQQSIDNKAAEDALREAQARAEADAKAAAEAEAAAQTPDYSYDYDYTPPPDGGAPNQTDDSCVDDLIFR
jgi:hypothetical protein